MPNCLAVHHSGLGARFGAPGGPRLAAVGSTPTPCCPAESEVGGSAGRRSGDWRPSTALDGGEADAAFCAVRPPGHHATPVRSMGFCMFNSAAVCAQALARPGRAGAGGGTTDAHHGNGTQDVVLGGRAGVMYVSWHQYPFYPGTGGLLERGEGAGAGHPPSTCPCPWGATGDVYRRGWEEAVLPAGGGV